MAQKILDIGTSANSRTGDPLRDAMVKVNDNFTELYSSVTAIVTETPETIKIKYESNDNTNCFTDDYKAKLDGIEEGATTDMTGDEIVETINTELGSTAWQSGGGIMSGDAIVTAINNQLGSIVWQSGTMTGAQIVTAINTELGSTMWQAGGGSGGTMTGEEIVSAINTELGSTMWQAGGGGGFLTVNKIESDVYTITDDDLVGGMGIAMLSDDSQVYIPANLSNNQPLLVINLSSTTMKFVAGYGVTLGIVDGRKALRAQYSSATIIPMGDEWYVIVGDLTTVLE